MVLHRWAARLFSFLFSLKLVKSSIPLLEKIRVASIYVVITVFILASVVNISFSIRFEAYLTAGFLITFLCLNVITLIVFWITRRIEYAKILLGLCVFLLIIEQIIDGGGVYGLGILYLMFGFPIVYLLFGLRTTLFFMASYYIGLLYRLNTVNFLPTSIFNIPGVTFRMNLILGIAMVLQAATCISLNIIIRHLIQLAYFDRVTALPNRLKFTSILEQRISFGPEKNAPVSVVAIKTVNLNKLNTMLGNLLADELLGSIGKRLSEYRNGTRGIGRWSSSIFVLWADLHDRRQIERYTTELIELLSRPYLIGDRVVSVFFNIAVSRYPEDADAASALVNNAISLLEQNRSQPGDVSFYTKDIQCCQTRMFGLLDDLNNADFDKEFYLVYQPKIRVTDKECVGAEVLLRWNNPKRGDVPPR